MLSISHSVGAGPAVNDPAGVAVIQRALNSVPPESGGPSAPLDSIGTISAGTLDAITAFQQARYANVDGRMDPQGRTA